MRAVRISVMGRVQGVYYRKYAVEKAKELNLRGIVKNEPDGSVTIIAIGDDENIKKYIDWTWIGSPASKVENVVITELEPQEVSKMYQDFKIVK